MPSFHHSGSVHPFSFQESVLHKIENRDTMPPTKVTKFKVAAAHAAPVFMDKAATIKKTVRLIEQAAADDVKLLVFPETFIPGYPVSGLHVCAMRTASQRESFADHCRSTFANATHL
jgi:hypothetical protein